MVKQKQASEKEVKVFSPTFTVHEFYQSKIDLNALKAKELKAIARHNNLTQSGNKGVLIERIGNCFKENMMAIKIQKHVRGKFARMVLAEEFRGGAFNNRGICVNGTDFMSMEPIDEIPFELFFSYTDSNNFTYGFDIHSLILLLRKTTGRVENPYNRSELSNIVIFKALFLYKLIRIVFPEFCIESDAPYTPNNTYMSRRRRIRRVRRRIRILNNDANGNETGNGENANENQQANTMQVDDADREGNVSNTHILTTYQIATVSFLANGSLEASTELISQIIQRQLYMVTVQEKPINTRVYELFMEIDQLGNYTNPQWFLNLSIPQLNTYLRNLRNLWRYQAQIPFLVKHQICPIKDPFTPSNTAEEPLQNINEEATILNYLRGLLLEPMENLVFSGIDIEFRKLGALHVLTALTSVSEDARTSFIWLYESMYA